MSLRDDLINRGLTDEQISYTVQGFLELLEDQLTRAAQSAHHSLDALLEGDAEEALGLLLPIEKTITSASFSHKTASMLLGQNGTADRRA